MFPKAKLRETLRSRGSKTRCFPQGLSLSVLLLLSYSKLDKNAKKSFVQRWLAHKFATVSRSMTCSCASQKFNMFFS